MTGVIEVMLLRWGENNTAGRTVTFQLPEEGEHPFKHLSTGTKSGQRMALSVALIADGDTVGPDAPIEKTEGERAVMQAGKLCNEEGFQSWLATKYPNFQLYYEDTGKTFSDVAAGIVRAVCTARSRAEFATNPEALARWKKLAGEYYDFPRHGV